MLVPCINLSGKYGAIINLITIDEAKQLTNSAQRILIIGCSGGGKSTLAQRIASKRNIKYISLDRDVRWLPGWQPRDADERRQRVQEFIRGDSWVMDGTYPSSFDIRLPRTELVMWIRIPRYLSLYSVYKRSILNYGKSRPDMAEGCIEKLPDREFFSYIWNFESVSAPRIADALETHGSDVPLVMLKDRAQINSLTA